jgi:ketosteroid isomerase-like protein
VHHAATSQEATEIIQAIEHFNAAFNLHDLDATMAAMTADCAFENTNPAPDGARHEGQDAVRSAFEQFFSSSPDARFDVEDMFASDDRCVVRWVYTWDEADPAGHVRGVDVFRVEDGKVAEKLSYVKG